MKARQFRGVSDVYVAKVLTDNEEGITFDTPKRLCFTATVSKETSSDSATVYLDNKPMIVVSSEGADEITITGSVIDLDVLAEIIGKTYDKDLDMLIDTERVPDYFAIGYVEGMTDGTKRYSFRYKGMFSIPGEEVNTADDGTDSTQQSLTFTGIMTEAKFEKAGNKGAKGIVVSDAKADVSDWFTAVKTPDEIVAKTPSA